MDFRNLRESLKTENYMHYYIHIDDSLDKLIDRTEIDYSPKHNQETTKTTLTQHQNTEIVTNDYTDQIQKG